MRAAARRPLVTGLIVTVLVLISAGFALRLQPSARTDTLVGRSSDAYRATTSLHPRFGDDPVIVLVRGDLRRTVLTDDLERVAGARGLHLRAACRAGVTPRGGKNGPCAQLARLNPRPVKVVYGPGTFINESVAPDRRRRSTRTKNAKSRRRSEAAQAARQARAPRRATPQARAGAVRASRPLSSSTTSSSATLLRLGLQLQAQRGIPRINDPNFVSQLVFDNARGPARPRRASPTCSRRATRR